MKTVFVMVALLTMAACGTITHGTSQRIACATNPAGARVITSGGKECTTPCALTLKREKDDLLTIQKEGYETVTLQVRSVASAATAANVLMPGGLLCWGIDHLSGGASRLVPEQVNIALSKRTPASGTDAKEPGRAAAPAAEAFEEP